MQLCGGKNTEADTLVVEGRCLPCPVDYIVHGQGVCRTHGRRGESQASKGGTKKGAASSVGVALRTSSTEATVFSRRKRLLTMENGLWASEPSAVLIGTFWTALAVAEPLPLKIVTFCLNICVLCAAGQLQDRVSVPGHRSEGDHRFSEGTKRRCRVQTQLDSHRRKWCLRSHRSGHARGSIDFDTNLTTGQCLQRKRPFPLVDRLL